MQRITTQRGFTLIELMLYIGIAATILLAASVLLANMLESRVKNQTIAEVEQQGLQVMEILTQAARNAESITTPAAGASASSLTLNVLDVNDDPTVFSVASGTVRITEGAGSAIALTNSRITVSGFTVQNLSRTNTPGALRVSFVVTYVNSSGRNEYTYSKRFYGSASLR